MKRIATVLLVFLLSFAAVHGQKAKQNYVIGFYNLENLFDIYDDPAKNDEQFLPEGSNKWTKEKYEHKLHNMARVIAEMAASNGRFHTILGVSEIENRFVLEDLVSDPQIASANYQIIHYDGPDRRGVDVALLYRPEQFKVLQTKSIPFTFEGSEVEFTLDKEQQDYFRTRDILMVRGTIAGEMFAFFVAHLPSRVGGKGSDLRSRGGEILYRESMALMEQFPGIKIVTMGDMNDNPTDDSMAIWHRGKEKPEDVTPTDFFCPYITMLKDGFGSLAYQGVWSIYDLELVNYNLLNAPEGTLKLQPIGKNGYYGHIFKRPFMTNQKGPYKGYPYRTFSGGSFIGGYSDHYPTFIVVGK